jgi:hypothetical protein
MSELPFQVALSMNNSAGELFGNRHLGVSVQRWTDLENFGEAVTLVDCMLEEMAFTGGDTIILDLSSLDASTETELYQLALTLFCVTGAHTKRVAVVGMKPELITSPGFEKLVRRAHVLEVFLTQSASFADAVAQLNASAPNMNGRILPEDAPAGDENTYGGNIKFLPLHASVILNLAGNEGDLAAVEHAVQRALVCVREKKAKLLLVDTTACSPIHDAEKLRFVLEQALPPMMKAGLAYFIHVRPKLDKLICVRNAPQISSLFRAAGISYERRYSIAEASVRLDKLAGYAHATAANSSSSLH